MPAVVSAGGHSACAEPAPKPAPGMVYTTCKLPHSLDHNDIPCSLVTHLQDCLPDVLQLQYDGSPELCTWLAGLLGSCAGQCPAVPVLHRLVSAMSELLAHQAAAVIKQALMACHTCCRAAVAAVVGQVGPEELDAVKTWTELHEAPDNGNALKSMCLRPARFFRHISTQLALRIAQMQ